MDSRGVEQEALSSSKGSRLKSTAHWIAERELWLLAVPVALMLFSGRVPLRIISASLWLIPIPWLCRWAARGYLTVRTPMDLPIVVLLGMAWVGLYPSVDLLMSKLVLYKMIVEFALFYGLINSLHSESRLQALVAVLLVSGVGVSILGLVGTGGMAYDFAAFFGGYGDSVRQLVRRLNEAGFNGNIVGGTLAMIFPLHLSLTLFDSRRLWKLLLGLSLPVVGGTLLLTQSRGAIVGVILALLVIGVWRSRWVLLSFPVLLGGIWWAVRRFGTQEVAEFLLVTNTTMTAAGRSELWQRAIYMLQDFPYTGIGLGAFSRVMPVLYPTFLIGPDAVVPQAHNLFLQTGVDLGIPGLVGFIAFLTAFSIAAVQTVRMARQTHLQPLAMGLLGGFMVYLVHGLVDAVTFSTKPGTVIWVIMGLTAALWLRLRALSRLERDHNEASDYAP